MEKKHKKTTDIHQRIDPVLKERFRKAAEKDNRSMGNALVIAIEEYIEKVMKKT